jgi:hypothetical protein
MSSYGKLPKDIGTYILHPNEVHYYLYLPVSMPGNSTIALPRALWWLQRLIDAVRNDEPTRFRNEYVYATVKRMFVGGGVTPNRPGWHCDGFLTNDLNYVWYDCVPTLFNSSEFTITPDHLESLREFEGQALPCNTTTYPNLTLLKLDSHVVHAVGEAPEQVMRTFVKISLSPEQYNLSDNSHNYEIDYEWKMFDRAAIRNDPHRAQRDSADPQAADDHFA